MHNSPGSATPKGTPSRRARSPRNSAESPTPIFGSTATAGETDRPRKTFISSMSIPVEGAIPIGPDGHPQRPTIEQVQADGSSEPKRAARKSKTDAIAALSSRGLSPSTGSHDHDTLMAKYLDGSAIQVNPALDLTSVKTPGARRPIVSKVPPRPMGIQHAPEYYPTMEEFKDPMGYIKSISEEAQQYGICKVVPPEGWEMPFVTDTETFRFKTRLQRLNSIEATSRAKLNFLEQLYRYHRQQGNPRVAVPTINHKPLDLWLLRKEVQRLGGYDEVTKAKKWPDMGRILGYGGVPGLSTQIKNSYTRVILPYEHFCKRVRDSSALAPLLARDESSRASLNSHAPPKPSKLGLASMNGSTPEPSSPLTGRSSPLSDIPDDGDKDPAISSARARRTLRSEDKPSSKPNSSIAAPLPQFPEAAQSVPKVPQEQTCEVCHKKNRGEEMLLCDGCDCGFHMFCLDPPLSAIPKDQWFCYTCLAGTGGDYGFDEGEEHSLSSFQARDKEFRRRWVTTHPPPDVSEMPEEMVSTAGDVHFSEYYLEEEFWRLVEDGDETVEIEYGADVHSTTHGSAMPTTESHPLDSYARDPWNLNNIAIVPDSLLRFIKSDISGMTVPWTYVGMTFSTFCWHNEDHFTHSVNFMHWGETKTWYGIPGEDAEKFEAAIKYEAPDLFEAQPDLLFQLVTLMNPKRVSEAGVRVHACNQRAGEFVITFPQAYHAGFNHGMNFNEAVNFALPDWLSLGLECVKRYREHRKLPVFSHDELLITITQQSATIKTALWLSESLQEMVTREMGDRTKARTSGLKEILVPEDRPEDQYQCTVCKVFCYLSQVTCSCTTKAVCVDHANLLCEKPLDHLSLRLRFADVDLLDLQRKVHDRASSPLQWKAKLDKLLFESARPALRSLRALVAEGERLSVQYQDLANLRKFVNKANEWVDTANSFFLMRKQSRNRARKSVRGRAAIEPEEADASNTHRGLDELFSLLDAVENLGFDSQEIGTLRSLGSQAEEAQTKTTQLLQTAVEDQDEAFLKECKMVLLTADSLNVHLEEVPRLLRIVDRDKLLKELQAIEQGGPITLEDVKKHLTRARACGLSDDSSQIRALEGRLQDGHDWEVDASELLKKPIKTIEEMQEFLDKESGVPVDPALLDKISSAHAKALDFDRQADAWLALAPGAPKPRLTEVTRLITRAQKEYDITSIRDLKKAADIAQDLESRCERVLKNLYDYADGEDLFSVFDNWRTYATTHLRIFHLPTFTRLEGQLDAHSMWLKELPWWCPDHEAPHTEVILQDVLTYTSPDDDAPPPDDFYTCICTKPVRPPAAGQASEAVQCDHCHARFHGACARSGGSCPFCDHHHWNGSLRKDRNWHSYYFPAILMKAPELSKQYSPHWKHLQVIIHRLDRLSNTIGTFLMFASQPVNQRQELLPQTRHFMRKLYQLQFAISPSPDISFGLDLAGLHRILAHMPAQPQPSNRIRRRFCHFTFGQDVDCEWSDGTRCICRGRTSYLLNYPTVKCRGCRRVYHSGCVFYHQNPANFECPICALRKGKTYPYSDVRVKPNVTSEDARDPEKYVDTKSMVIVGHDRLIFCQMKPPTKPTLFVELVRFKASDNDPSGFQPPSQSNGSGHAPPPPPGNSNAEQSPPPPPWANAAPQGPRGSAAPRGDSRNPYPYPPSRPAASGSSAPEPAYQNYDSRVSKKRKVDDLHKFNGDVALYGAHGDHAGNRRWNDRGSGTSSSSSSAPRVYPGDVSTRLAGSREPTMDPVTGPSRSSGQTFPSPELPRRDIMERHLEDSAYRGSKRKQPEDEPEMTYPGQRPPAPPRGMSGSVTGSPTSPRDRNGGQNLSPSLAMLMSPLNQPPSPPPAARRGRGYSGDTPTMVSGSASSSRGPSAQPLLPPIHTAVRGQQRLALVNPPPVEPGPKLPPINAIIGKQP